MIQLFKKKKYNQKPKKVVDFINEQYMYNSICFIVFFLEELERMPDF